MKAENVYDGELTEFYCDDCLVVIPWGELTNVKIQDGLKLYCSYCRNYRRAIGKWKARQVS